MKDDIREILVSEEQIQARVQELAKALVAEYADKVPTVVCVLKGSVMFYTDLLRHMQIPLSLDFMSVSSYRSGTTGGAIHIRQELTTDISGKDVLIVEDIMDSGRTLNLLKPLLLKRGAKSVKIVTLPARPGRDAGAGLRGLPDRGRVRGGLRPGLRGALPQPALHRCAEAVGLRKHVTVYTAFKL